MSNAEIVDAWFRERIAKGPIARDGPAYNQAFAAKADLIARLDATVAHAVRPPETAPEPAPPPAEPPAPPPIPPETAADAASDKE
jgi:hypothetical protein